MRKPLNHLLLASALALPVPAVGLTSVTPSQSAGHSELAQGQLPRGTPSKKRSRQIRPQPKRTAPTRPRRSIQQTSNRRSSVARQQRSSIAWLKIALALVLVLVTFTALVFAWIYYETHPQMDTRWLQGLQPSGAKHRTELATRTVMSRPPTTGLRTNTSQMQQRKRARSA